MKRVKVNDVELEYEVRGSGEPILLIDMLIADCFVPLLDEPSLAGRYQLIRYHKRGWVGSTHTPPPVSIGDHAADAAALLGHLGVRRAHIAGHSTGASIAAQLALDYAENVHTLTLLEPTLVSLPLGQAFLRAADPVFEAYGNGDHSGAFAMFVDRRKRARVGSVSSAARGADPRRGCAVDQRRRHLLRRRAAFATRLDIRPRAGGRYPPARPVRAGCRNPAALGRDRRFLRSSLPYIEDRTIEGAGSS